MNTTSLRSQEKVKWEKKQDRLYVGLVIATHITGTNKGVNRQIAFRLDGRDGDYRVDVKTLHYTPWESIDNGLGSSTVWSAKKVVKKWLTQEAICY